MEMIMLSDFLIFGVIAFFGGLIAVPVGGSFLFLIPAFLFTGLSGLEAILLGRLAMIGAMSSSSAYFFQKTEFDTKKISGFILGNLSGVLFGAFLATRINADVFTKLLLWILLIGAVFLLFNIQVTDQKFQKKAHVFLPIIGFFIGVYGGIGGGGNGKMIVLVLTILLGWNIHRAIVNTRFIELLLNIVAVAGYLLFGATLTGFELPVIIGALLGGFLGAKITLKSKPKWLKYAFATLVFLSAIKVTFF